MQKPGNAVTCPFKPVCVHTTIPGPRNSHSSCCQRGRQFGGTTPKRTKSAGDEGQLSGATL